MENREKVIKAYECCKNPIIKGCERCPYEKICYHDQFCLTAIKDAIELLKEQPQIVRCKDCKWHDNPDDSPKYLPCMEMRTNPNWFCADGIQR